MAVEVRVPTVLRKHTEGARAVNGSGATIRELFQDLEVRHPGFSSALVTEAGELQRFINVYLNDEDIRFIGSLETPVSDGDIVSILPAVAGGAR